MSRTRNSACLREGSVVSGLLHKLGATSLSMKGFCAFPEVNGEKSHSLACGVSGWNEPEVSEMNNKVQKRTTLASTSVKNYPKRSGAYSMDKGRNQIWNSVGQSVLYRFENVNE